MSALAMSIAGELPVEVLAMCHEFKVVEVYAVLGLADMV